MFMAAGSSNPGGYHLNLRPLPQASHDPAEGRLAGAVRPVGVVQFAWAVDADADQKVIDRLFADTKYASEAAADGDRPGVVAVCLPVGGNDR